MPESPAERIPGAPTASERAPPPADRAAVEPAPGTDPVALAAPAGSRADIPDTDLQDAGIHALAPRAAGGADPGLDPDAVPERRPAAAPNGIVFTPDRLDVVAIGSTIARYVQGEGEAAWAHFRALSDARTAADLFRLQVDEVQRAADASLSCWVTVIGKASRVVALR